MVSSGVVADLKYIYINTDKLLIKTAMQWPHLLYHETILYIREMGSAGYYFRGVNTYRALPKIRDLGRSEHYFGDQKSTDDPPPPHPQVEAQYSSTTKIVAPLQDIHRLQ